MTRCWSLSRYVRLAPGRQLSDATCVARRSSGRCVLRTSWLGRADRKESMLASCACTGPTTIDELRHETSHDAALVQYTACRTCHIGERPRPRVVRRVARDGRRVGPVGEGIVMPVAKESRGGVCYRRGWRKVVHCRNTSLFPLRVPHATRRGVQGPLGPGSHTVGRTFKNRAVAWQERLMGARVPRGRTALEQI